MPFELFDRSRLKILPLSERMHDLNYQRIAIAKQGEREPFEHAALPILAERIVAAKRAGRTILFCCGAHVLRQGNSPLLIDLMEKGLLTHLAFNGAGAIHDFELALIGQTCESVARYIREGQFGLWEETGRLNEAVEQGYRDGLGFGEAVGRMIEQESFPYRDTSVLAAGYRLQVPVTIHVCIGQDIVHEHPSFDGAAAGATSYTDFLIYAQAVTRLEGGVFLNFGSAVMGPEVYLKALAMARNVAHQQAEEICHFTTAVFDLPDLGDDLSSEAPKHDPRYYFRPFKTILVRTVADGGESYYVQGDHRATFPGFVRRNHEAVVAMKTNRLEEILHRFPRLRIAVLGDFFLDHYLLVDPSLAEPSVETGKIAHQVIGTRSSAGAAGTVVNNLSALGVGRLFAVGAVGDDGAAFELRRALRHIGCDTEGLIDSAEIMTPIYMKPVDEGGAGLAAEHSRYDVRNRCPTPISLIRKVIQAAEELLDQVDAMIVVDQIEDEDCETVTPLVREWLNQQAGRRTDKLFWADSRFHVAKYHGVWIKPNQFEALGRRPMSPDDHVDRQEVMAALPRLRQGNGAPVTVTLGDQGILISDPGPCLLPAFPVQGPIDSTGAGDSLTAGMVASLCAGATQEEAGWVGNLVASLTVEQLGTTGTARPEQVVTRLEEWRQREPARFLPEE